MAKHNTGNTGNTAREMAAAPLHIDAATAPVPETAMAAALVDATIELMQREQAETVKAKPLPFTLCGFKLNGKAKDYPVDEDPGATSRKVAFAQIRVADSGLIFPAAISVVSKKIAGGEHDGKTARKIACKFPNQGQSTGYKPLFETDDPRLEREIATFRKSVADEYVAWSKTLDVRPETIAGRKHEEDTVSLID